MRAVYRLGPYVKTHARHFLQQSEYTICLAYDTSWRFERYDEVFNDGPRQQGMCWKITLPATERRTVLKELERLGPLTTRARGADTGTQCEQGRLEVAARCVVGGDRAEIAADGRLRPHLEVADVARDLRERLVRVREPGDRSGGADGHSTVRPRDPGQP